MGVTQVLVILAMLDMTLHMLTMADTAGMGQVVTLTSHKLVLLESQQTHFLYLV
jgi:hypothetical protein